MIEYRKINIEEEQQFRNLGDVVIKGLERKEFFIPFTEEKLKDIFNNDKVIIYGAYDGQELIGTAQLYFDESCIRTI